MGARRGWRKRNQDPASIYLHLPSSLHGSLLPLYGYLLNQVGTYLLGCQHGGLKRDLARFHTHARTRTRTHAHKQHSTSTPTLGLYISKSRPCRDGGVTIEKGLWGLMPLHPTYWLGERAAAAAAGGGGVDACTGRSMYRVSVRAVCGLLSLSLSLSSRLDLSRRATPAHYPTRPQCQVASDGLPAIPREDDRFHPPSPKPCSRGGTREESTDNNGLRYTFQ